MTLISLAVTAALSASLNSVSCETAITLRDFLQHQIRVRLDEVEPRWKVLWDPKQAAIRDEIRALGVAWLLTPPTMVVRLHGWDVSGGKNLLVSAKCVALNQQGSYEISAKHPNSGTWQMQIWGKALAKSHLIVNGRTVMKYHMTMHVRYTDLSGDVEEFVFTPKSTLTLQPGGVTFYSLNRDGSLTSHYKARH